MLPIGGKICVTGGLKTDNSDSACFPGTSTGGPNHACMMVAVRVADFGCGGAAPPLEAAEPPLVWLAQRENLGV